MKTIGGKRILEKVYNYAGPESDQNVTRLIQGYLHLK